MIIVCDSYYFLLFFVNELAEYLFRFFIGLLTGEHRGNTFLACCGVFHIKVIVAEQLIDSGGIGLHVAKGYFLASLLID